MKDWQFFPVSGTYMGWGVKPDSPFKTFQDVLDATKKRPVTMSHSGVGGIWHEGDGILAKAAGVQFNYIPYKGGPLPCWPPFKARRKWPAAGCTNRSNF